MCSSTRATGAPAKYLGEPDPGLGEDGRDEQRRHVGVQLGDGGDVELPTPGVLRQVR